MDVDSVRGELVEALAAFRRYVFGINLFEGWQTDYRDRLRQAYTGTLNLLQAVEACREGLSESGRKCTALLTSKSQYNTACSIYELVRLILEANDSGRSADYLGVFMFGEKVEECVERLISELEKEECVERLISELEEMAAAESAETNG